ncbi:MAG TPA: lipoyl(octanoyl) transferase LipB [Alphaproteobacteria bacterium]|nr:lipoyl(octanoyl) transferase LipB [Alphaproteobacteria bacterium]
MSAEQGLHDRISGSLEWRLEQHPIAYPEALDIMEHRVAAIAEGRAPELLWLLEHPCLYTAGTSAKPVDLIQPDRFPVFRTGRGGQYTYHGPGQRVGYVMIDLRRRGRADLRLYVQDLEEWLIRTLARFDVRGERRPGRVGIWVVRPGGSEEKIAAIGVRIRRWITYHGISINRDPDLSHFQGIVPCGVADRAVTSLAALGLEVSSAALDRVLIEEFENVFGGPS